MTMTGKLLCASSVSAETNVQPKEETRMLKVDDNHTHVMEVKPKYLDLNN